MQPLPIWVNPLYAKSNAMDPSNVYVRFKCEHEQQTSIQGQIYKIVGIPFQQKLFNVGNAVEQENVFCKMGVRIYHSKSAKNCIYCWIYERCWRMEK